MEVYLSEYALEAVALLSVIITMLLVIHYRLAKERKNLSEIVAKKNEEISVINTILEYKEQLLTSGQNSQILLSTKIEQITEEKFTLQKELEINQLKYSTVQAQFTEWEKLKEESIINAKAAIFAVGNQLSSKLLEDHKREAEQAKQESEKIVKETTNNLHTQFQNIITSVATMNEQIQHSNASFEKIKRSLLSPIGAGSLAEITLENILKSSGLIAGKDYIIQFTVNSEESFGIRLRPDAMIFLPSNNIMVIDSKASQYFMHLESEMPEEVIKGKIKSVMRTHLKDLINKAYLKAVKEEIEKSYNLKVNYISLIMFLPSEAALERVQSIDNKFMMDAWENNIYPAGPVGLVNILSYTKFMISENDKIENHRHIIEQVEKLLDSISKVYEHTGKIGANLNTTIKNFDKLVSSFNTGLTPKIQKLEKLGLQNASQIKFKKFSRGDLIQSNESNIIEVSEQPNLLFEDES
jgi:DNA recombination protein RmuC